MFDISVGNLLIIAFLFMTTLNCLITYFCSSSSLSYLNKTQSYNKAITRIHICDKYILTGLNLITSVLYVVLAYGYFCELLGDSDYFVALSVLLGFVLSVITTFFSRLCYCYVCNVLLKTTLNAKDCFRENFFYLLRMFFPVFLVSFVVPTIYVLPIGNNYRNMGVVVFLGVYLFIWLLSTPYKTMLFLNARKIPDSDLSMLLNKLFKDNGIKKYSLYYWDSSDSKENNALMSGIFKKYLFVSSTLIATLTDKELEAVVLHEIGHLKNNHLKKMLVFKMILLLAVSVMVVYLVLFETIKIFMIFILIVIFILAARINLSNSKKCEEQADLYVNSKGYGKYLISALKKIELDGICESKIDEFLSSHPNSSKRISKIEDKE